MSDNTPGQTRTVETTSTTKFPVYVPSSSSSSNRETTSESPSTVTAISDFNSNEKSTENSIEDFSNRIEKNFVLRNSVTTEVPSTTTLNEIKTTFSSTTITDKTTSVAPQKTTKLFPVEQTTERPVQTTTVKYTTLTGEYSSSSQSLKELENLLIQRTTEIASRPKTTLPQLSVTSTIKPRTRKPKVTTIKPRTSTYSDEEDASFLVRLN